MICLSWRITQREFEFYSTLALAGPQFKAPMGNVGMYQGFPDQGMTSQQGQQGMHDQQGMQHQQVQQQPVQSGMPQMGMQQGFPCGGYAMEMQRAMMAGQPMNMGGMGGGEGQHQLQGQLNQQQQGDDSNLGMMQVNQLPQVDQQQEDVDSVKQDGNGDDPQQEAYA